MARLLRYHPLVADEILAAINWYEERSAGLGERFRSAVDARFDGIPDRESPYLMFASSAAITLVVMIHLTSRILNRGGGFLVVTIGGPIAAAAIVEYRRKPRLSTNAI